MLAGLVALLVVFVAVIVVLALAMAAVGLVIGGAVALTVLAFKLAPLLLLGWLAVKVLGTGSRGGGTRRLHHARVSPDDAWLDSRV